MAFTVKNKNPEAARELLKTLQGLEKKTGKVGWIEGSTYPETGQPVAQVAAAMEFGIPSKNVPPRSIFRATIDASQEKWGRVLRYSANRILRGEEPPSYLMERQVLVVSGDVRKHISNLSEPPLAMSTILARVAKKKRGKVSKSIAKPLVDSGILLNTLTGIVE